MLRLCSSRYVPVLVVPFVVGYLAGGGGSELYLLGGVALTALGEVVANLANNRADRVEDAIDYPVRTTLCERVGYRTMGRLAITGSAVYVAGAIGLVVATDAPRSILPGWLLMITIGWLYSVGPRFKARTGASIVTMGLIVPACFWVGWRYSGGIIDGLPMAELLLLVRISCPGAKDAPNSRGDDTIGFTSVYRRLAGNRGRLPRLVLVVQPYVAAISLAAMGAVRPAVLWVLAVAPVGFVYLRVVEHATSESELNAVRELSNVYQYLLVGGMLLGVYPNPLVPLLTAGAVMWYLLITRYAHTERGILTSRTLTTIRSLVR